MKKNYGEQHDPDRRGVEQDCRNRQGHHLDGGKIAGREEQDAAQPQSQEKRDILYANPKSMPVFDKQKKRKDYCGNRKAHADDLNGGKAGEGGKASDKDAHASPENACQYNK